MREKPPATEHLFGQGTAGAYATVVSDTAAVLAEHVRRVRQPYSGAGVDELARLVDAVDLDAPLGDTGAAVDEVARLYLDHAVWFHEPGYQAHLNCPVALPALAAEVLVSGVNSSVDTWDQSATGTLIERRLVAWTADRIGLGAAADGVFTSGGTQSNLQGLLLAREEALARRGLAGAPAGERADALARLRVFATSQSHFSVQKAAHVLGLSDDAVVEVATDERWRMSPAALRRAVDEARAAGGVPAAVVATAGTTDLGAVDPIAPLAEVAAAAGLWLHVDAAYGCGLLVSRRRRHLLAGIERADSVTVDYHKSFFQPVSASALVVRQEASLRHVTHHADYLNPRGAGVPNQVDRSLQTTRRLDALKLWLTLRTMGADTIGELFDAGVDLAHAAYELVRADPDVEAATAPTLGTLLFRYRPGDGDRPALDQATTDRVTPLIRARLLAGGEAVVGGTTLDGHPWLKLTLLNPTTTLDDVAAVLEHVRRAGRDLLAASTGAPVPGHAPGAGRGERAATVPDDPRSLIEAAP